MEIVCVNAVYTVGLADSVYRKRLGDCIVQVARPQYHYVGPEWDTAFLITHFHGLKTPKSEGRFGIFAFERTVLLA